MRKPQDCVTMADLRAEIDRLDEALVAMLAERAGYIDRAAQIIRETRKLIGEGLNSPAETGTEEDPEDETEENPEDESEEENEDETEDWEDGE